MLFNSFEFILYFLTTVVVYFTLSHKFRWSWLLLASYYFYFSWEPRFTLLLLTSTTIDYFCGLRIYSSNKPTVRKAYLIVSIIVNLSLLIFFKYLGFLTETTLDIIRFFGIDIPLAVQVQSNQFSTHILLPIGISFYTFQTLSYSIEIYRRNLKPEKHFGRYALYVSFFPQLLAGPIERAQNLIPQIKKKVSLNIHSIRVGLMLMAWGFFMKMVVSDRLGAYVDIVFDTPQSYPGIPLIIGAFFFLFQIYLDFAAYSIIAIGAARIIGFNLMTNFNRPVYAKDARDFWGRWHISFMTWLRDYLYRPLVKKYGFKRYWALLVIFVICGIWHGAGWNFIIWGVMNGLYLLFEIATSNYRKKVVKLLSKFIHPLIPQFAWWGITISFIAFTLIFFRSPTFHDAINYLLHIPKLDYFPINPLNDRFELVLSFMFLFIVQAVNYLKPDHKVYELIINKSSMVRWFVYIIFILIIVFFSAVRNNPFIYFQF